MSARGWGGLIRPKFTSATDTKAASPHVRNCCLFTNREWINLHTRVPFISKDPAGIYYHVELEIKTEAKDMTAARRQRFVTVTDSHRHQVDFLTEWQTFKAVPFIIKHYVKNPMGKVSFPWAPRTHKLKFFSLSNHQSKTKFTQLPSYMAEKKVKMNVFTLKNLKLAFFIWFLPEKLLKLLVCQSSWNALWYDIAVIF